MVYLDGKALKNGFAAYQKSFSLTYRDFLMVINIKKILPAQGWAKNL